MNNVTKNIQKLIKSRENHIIIYKQSKLMKGNSFVD
jgi:hypothetical protein